MSGIDKDPMAGKTMGPGLLQAIVFLRRWHLNAWWGWKSRSTIQNDEITYGKSCKRQLVYWSLNPSASWVRLISLRMEVLNSILWNTLSWNQIWCSLGIEKWIVCQLAMHCSCVILCHPNIEFLFTLTLLPFHLVSFYKNTFSRVSQYIGTSLVSMSEMPSIYLTHLPFSK